MNKQNNKETLQKKCKSLTILTIVGWSLNVLLVLFLILCAALTPKKAHSQSAEQEISIKMPRKLDINIQDYFVYSTIYDDEDVFTLNMSDQLAISGNNYDILDTPSTDVVIYKSYPLDGYIVYLDGEVKPCASVLCTFYTFEITSTSNAIRLLNILFETDYDVYEEYVHKTDNNYNHLTYHVTNSDFMVYLNSTPVDNPVFDYLFTLTDTNANVTDFAFNKNFNYNAPFGLSASAVYGSRSDGQTGLFFTKTYDVGWFLSNGELYNQIVWRSQATMGAVSVYLDGEIKKGPQGYDNCVYVSLEYVNTLSNKTMVVNSRDQQSYEKSGAYGYYYQNSSTWYNDEYRYITFLNTLSDDVRIAINSFNNNNQNYVSGQMYGDGDVFTLLGSALSSWQGIFGAMILPGITIGTLLFVPLIATIVFAIIKIIKK